MQLGVRDVSKLLGVSEKTIYRSIPSSGRSPERPRELRDAPLGAFECTRGMTWHGDLKPVGRPVSAP
jgi:hypothetical protein